MSDNKALLRTPYLKTMLQELEKRHAFIIREQQAPLMSIELTMAQFVAAGMFLCKHTNPQAAEQLFRDMMQNREAIASKMDTIAEEIFNKAIKDVAHGRGN